MTSPKKSFFYKILEDFYDSILFFLVVVFIICVIIVIIIGHYNSSNNDLESTKTEIVLSKRAEWIPLRATVYTPKKSQTKSYLILASGEKVRNNDEIYMQRICSVSQDLLNVVSYGDTIRVESSHPLLSGLWIVLDCMDPSMRQRVDFLVSRKDLQYFRAGVYNVKIKKY